MIHVYSSVPGAPGHVGGSLRTFGTVDEVADEIARFVLELEESGVARELLIKLSVRLVAARQEREGW